MRSEGSLVGPSGLEPPTSCLSGTRSNLLSYEPMWLVSDLRHLNLFASLFRKASLLTFLLEESKWWRWRDSTLARTTRSVIRGSDDYQSSFTTAPTSNPVVGLTITNQTQGLIFDCWWRWRDSNPWPPACRAGALPAELHPHGLDLLSFRFFRGRFFLPRCQHWAIFPCGRPQSIFTTAELNFRVRNGNGWTLCVCNTDYFNLSQRTFSLFSENWTTNSVFSLSRPSFTLQVVWPITLSP